MKIMSHSNSSRGGPMLVTNFDYNTLFQTREDDCALTETPHCLTTGASAINQSASTKVSSLPSSEQLSLRESSPTTKKRNKLFTRVRSLRNKSKESRSYPTEDDFDKLIEDIYYTYQFLESDGDNSKLKPQEGGFFSPLVSFSADLFTRFQKDETKSNSSPSPNMEVTSTDLESDFTISASPIRPKWSTYMINNNYTPLNDDMSEFESPKKSLGVQPSRSEENRAALVKHCFRPSSMDEPEMNEPETVLPKEPSSTSTLRRAITRLGRKKSDISYKWGHRMSSPALILTPLNRNVVDTPESAFQLRYETGFIKTRKIYNENEDDLSIAYDMNALEPIKFAASKHKFAFLRATRREEGSN